MSNASDEEAGDAAADSATETDDSGEVADQDGFEGSGGAGVPPGVGEGEGSHSDDELEELRKRVEDKYDFENFGPADMAEMTPDEWEVAFDADSWITGDELLGRVEWELKTRIADRDVFATLEYAELGGHRCLVAYSDVDYAIVYPDGSVEGRGTVVRDVKPTVALCSMDSYEVETPPANWQLPEPEEVSESGSELGNWMLQLLAASQLLLGFVAIGAAVVQGIGDQLVLATVGVGLIVIGLILFTLVANARLSEKFRMQEYENRLRSVGSGERPAFLPIEDDAFERSAESRERLEGRS